MGSVTNWNFDKSDWGEPDPGVPDYFSALISGMGERAQMAHHMGVAPSLTGLVYTLGRPGDQHFGAVNFDFDRFDASLEKVAACYYNHTKALQPQIDAWLLKYHPDSVALGAGIGTYLLNESSLVSFVPDRWSMGAIGLYLNWDYTDFMVAETQGWAGKPMGHISRWIKTRYDAINLLRDIWLPEQLDVILGPYGTGKATERDVWHFSTGLSEVDDPDPNFPPVDKSTIVCPCPCAIVYDGIDQNRDNTIVEDCSVGSGVVLRWLGGITESFEIQYWCLDRAPPCLAVALITPRRQSC